MTVALRPTICALALSATLLLSPALARRSPHPTTAANPSTQANANAVNPLRFRFTPAELKGQCDAVLASAQKKIDAIAKMPDGKRTFANTVGALEQVNTSIDDWLAPVDLLSQAATDKDLQAAAGDCNDRVSAFYARLMVRPDLYHALTVVAQKEQFKGDQARLLTENLRAFKRSGAGLSAAERDEVTRLRDELSKLETEFNRNIAQANDSVELDESDVKGLSPSFVSGLKKTEKGTWRLTLLDASQLIPFLENASSATARQKVLTAKEKVAVAANVPLLEKAIALRTRIARMLGYPSHAAYVLEERMAQKPARVRAFLDDLTKRLRPKEQRELSDLLALKKKDDPTATRLDPWDINYYTNQMKKSRFSLDAEKVREYFPVDHVLSAVFEIYQQLLGVRFHELAESSPESKAVGQRWAPDVRLFEVDDAASGRRIGFFFLDLYPRPNKYKHFAAFSLRAGYLRTDGRYQAPMAAIVGNFPAPRPDAPALLRHNEVETFFHEFGHIMHKVLTEARYASLAGSAVRRDFVEAPSQMLENWAWSPKTLALLSSHYQTGQPLPKALVTRMLASRHAGDGVFYSRQLFFATVDLDYHTGTDKVDTTKIWNARKQEILCMAPIEGGAPQATFGHLMGGYDAGYYGYLWSKVFAEDMFTVFEKAGLTSPKAGQQYRMWILARGNTADPDTLLKGFLGRTPNPNAFYKSIGLGRP